VETGNNIPEGKTHLSATYGTLTRNGEFFTTLLIVYEEKTCAYIHMVG